LTASKPGAEDPAMHRDHDVADRLTRLMAELRDVCSELVEMEKERRGPRFVRPDPEDRRVEAARRRHEDRLTALEEARSFYAAAAQGTFRRSDGSSAGAS
jgi:hypothetical protein